MAKNIFILFILSILLPEFAYSVEIYNNKQEHSAQQDTSITQLPQIETTDPFLVETTSSVRLFRDMGNSSSVILYIPSKETVEVFEEIDNYYSASYEGEKGYIIKAKVKPLNFETNSESSELSSENKKDRLTYLQEKYDGKTADALFKHKIWIGMTTQMALDSWGYPKSMDRYMQVEKKIEDWNYSKYTLVFSDSKLIRWEKK